MESTEPVEIRSRALLSLSSDRGTSVGSYIDTVAALSDKKKRKVLLADARKELAAFRQKFQMLKELAAVFKAIDSFAEETTKA